MFFNNAMQQMALSLTIFLIQKQEISREWIGANNIPDQPDNYRVQDPDCTRND